MACIRASRKITNINQWYRKPERMAVVPAVVPLSRGRLNGAERFAAAQAVVRSRNLPISRNTPPWLLRLGPRVRVPGAPRYRASAY
jgi:hypothetical protein